jgi:hypothetical protein
MTQNGNREQRLAEISREIDREAESVLSDLRDAYLALETPSGDQLRAVALWSLQSIWTARNWVSVLTPQPGLEPNSADGDTFEHLHEGLARLHRLAGELRGFAPSRPGLQGPEALSREPDPFVSSRVEAASEAAAAVEAISVAMRFLDTLRPDS